MTTTNPDGDEYNYHDSYWRCGRADDCGLPAGWGTNHVGVGACKLHGGRGGRPIEHGIYSSVVRAEDQPVLDALEDISTARKLEETLNLQVMKLRRAVALLDDPDREADFWSAFMTLVEQSGSGGDVDPMVLRELSKMLETPHRAQRDLMDLIRKTAKDLHSITEGEQVSVDHGVDDDDLDELRGLLEDAY